MNKKDKIGRIHDRNGQQYQQPLHESLLWITSNSKTSNKQ